MQLLHSQLEEHLGTHPSASRMNCLVKHSASTLVVVGFQSAALFRLVKQLSRDIPSGSPFSLGLASKTLRPTVVQEAFKSVNNTCSVVNKVLCLQLEL